MGRIKEGYWIVRTWEAGNVGEKVKFFVPGAKPDRRARRKEKEQAKKQAQNAYAAERRLARDINANFGPGDWLLGLDYGPEGMARVEKRAEALLRADKILLEAADPETGEVDQEKAWRLAVWYAARKEAENCLRRVKRLLEKDGIELRYVLVTSDMDGDTGEPVRVHHHLLINREAREAFQVKWAALGGVDWSALSNQDDYTAIAVYLIRQVRHVEDAKKYTSSRNLVRPEPKDRIAVSDADLRIPKGGELIYRAEYCKGQAQYVRYVLPEKKKRRHQQAAASGGLETPPALRATSPA